MCQYQERRQVHQERRAKAMSDNQFRKGSYQNPIEVEPGTELYEIFSEMIRMADEGSAAGHFVEVRNRAEGEAMMQKLRQKSLLRKARRDGRADPSLSRNKHEPG
jgi:hypothetical protein